MSQRFIPFSMGIYSSDQTLLLGFFFFQKDLRYLSFAIGTALLAKLSIFFFFRFLIQVLDLMY